MAAYIQEKDIMDPSKLVGLSYGQYRSVSTNETSEGRARNRRVEFVIIDQGADIKSMNDYYDEFTNSMDAGSVMVTGGEAFDTIEGGSENAASAVPEGEINPPDDTVQPDESAADVPAE